MAATFQRSMRITLLIGALMLGLQICCPGLAHGAGPAAVLEEFAPASMDPEGSSGPDADEDLGSLWAHGAFSHAPVCHASPLLPGPLDLDRSGLALLLVTGLQPSAP